VTGVEISRDLKNAKISFSTLGGSPDRADVLKGFNSAAGYLRRELAHRLNIRVTPELSFVFDDSIEHGVNLVQLIDRVVVEDNAGGADRLKRASKRK
jgi:ribosome-binding factor A